MDCFGMLLIVLPTETQPTLYLPPPNPLCLLQSPPLFSLHRGKRRAERIGEELRRQSRFENGFKGR